MSFRKISHRNNPKNYGNHSILVLNHASSFMDPLIVAVTQKPIVYFMTRSDVFKPATNWLLWASQMVPIYRAQDGEGAVEKNSKVFSACYKLLKRKRSILIFGEGFTDDVFVRRLKPLKKGAARIAIGAMVDNDWSFDLKVQCCGINYEDPGQKRSNVLVSNSSEINVLDYKSLYEENPNAAINKLTSDIATELKEQITHIEDKSLCETHENIMKITRKGMNANSSDQSISIDERQVYSKNLANYFNELPEEKPESFEKLKKRLEKYFRILKRTGLDHEYVHELSEKEKLSTIKNWLHLILGWPFFILGVVHMGIPRFITKRFVENKMKRKVFWSSVKMVLGMFIGGLFNLIFIWAFYNMVYPSWSLGIVYYIMAPGHFYIYANYYHSLFFDLIKRNKINNMDTSAFVKRYKELQIEVKDAISVS